MTQMQISSEKRCFHPNEAVWGRQELIRLMQGQCLNSVYKMADRMIGI